MAKGLQVLFLALRHAVAATLVLLPACSDVALPSEDMPASGPDPGYNNLVANSEHLQRDGKSATSITRAAPAGRLRGWPWLTTAAGDQVFGRKVRHDRSVA